MLLAKRVRIQHEGCKEVASVKSEKRLGPLDRFVDAKAKHRSRSVALIRHWSRAAAPKFWEREP